MLLIFYVIWIIKSFQKLFVWRLILRLRLRGILWSFHSPSCNKIKRDNKNLFQACLLRTKNEKMYSRCSPGTIFHLTRQRRFHRVTMRSMQGCHDFFVLSLDWPNLSRNFILERDFPRNKLFIASRSNNTVVITSRIFYLEINITPLAWYLIRNRVVPGEPPTNYSAW